MDDMNLFDRFHAAFEVAPPRGAFERLQRDLIKQSAAGRRRRPAFHVRWTKMTLRLTAAVAAVVIAIALLAAYLSGHGALTGATPAGSGGGVAAYQQLIKTNDDAWVNEPFNCVQVTDASCAHDLAANKAILVKWRGDLGSFDTPQRFAVIDAQIKRHLESLIRMAGVMATAINTRNQALFDAANNYATAATNWLTGVSVGISATRAVTASQYADLLQTNYSILAGSQSLTGTICASLQDALCQHDLTAGMQGIGQMQADVIEYEAPSALADRDLNVQKDLAQADSALMQMGEALVNNDSAALRMGSAAFSDALIALSSDLQS